jgi:hypothetical protein
MALLPIVELGLKLLKQVIPDPAARREAELKLLQLSQDGELAHLKADTDLALGQIEINKVEAANSNLFVAGWRPAMGWVCVLIFLANYIGVPMLAWVSPKLGMPPPTRLDLGEVLPVLMGMLGLGALRTTEKIKG